MTISRRLFLGGVVTTAAGAKPMLRTFVHDLDLQVDRALELQEGDVLVVRVPLDMSCEGVESIAAVLERDVWPNVVVVPVGVEFDVVRRSSGYRFVTNELLADSVLPVRKL